MEEEKKALKGQVGEMSRFYLGYQIMLLVGSIVGIVIVAVPLFKEGQSLPMAQFEAMIGQHSGLVSLVALGVAAAYLFWRRRHRLRQTDLRNWQTPTWALLGLAVGLIFVTQSAYLILGPVVENVAQLFGYTMAPYVNDIAETGNTLSMLLYACFLGPIMEEVLFRGVLLHQLAPYGKKYSILITAILFGFFHGELVQGIFAFLMGLVLGYLATIYGIKWSIYLHIFNNLMASTILGAILGLFPSAVNTLVTDVMTFGGGLVGLWFLWQQRQGLKDTLEETTLVKGAYAITFRSPWFLLALLWGVISCLSVFSPL